MTAKGVRVCALCVCGGGWRWGVGVWGGPSYVLLEYYSGKYIQIYICFKKKDGGTEWYFIVLFLFVIVGRGTRLWEWVHHNTLLVLPIPRPASPASPLPSKLPKLDCEACIAPATRQRHYLLSVVLSAVILQLNVVTQISQGCCSRLVKITNLSVWSARLKSACGLGAVRMLCVASPTHSIAYPSLQRSQEP